MTQDEINLVEDLVGLSGEDIYHTWGKAEYPFCFLGSIKNRTTFIDGCNGRMATGCVSQICYGPHVAENAQQITNEIKRDQKNILNFEYSKQIELGKTENVSDLWDRMTLEERKTVITRFIYWQNRYKETIDAQTIQTT